VYHITLHPAEAELTAEAAGVKIENSGGRWTVTVESPEEYAEVELVASLSGYRDERVRLRPEPGQSQERTIRLLATTMTNSIGMRFQLIPAGEFLMGSPDSDRDAGRDEKPQHRVRITRPFYLGVYPVTQSQWLSVMDRNPSRFKGPDNPPVEMVSWNDCQEFIYRLNERRDERGNVYRLPTEAEWEYACRAGSTTIYSFGDSADSLRDYGWYLNNSGGPRTGSTYPVGQKKPNAWGLYDMHGNVLEWCQDWYDSEYYAASPINDPTGPLSGSDRVNRGGGWYDHARLCRSAYRYRDTPDYRSNSLGFRLAFSSVDQFGQ
jgi:formylglycine-generating enzyme required for sulfatase activity